MGETKNQARRGGDRGARGATGESKVGRAVGGEATGDKLRYWGNAQDGGGIGHCRGWQGVGATAAAEHCTGVRPTNSSAQMLELRAKDGASIAVVRAGDLGLGNGLESTQSRGAPATRRLTNNWAELDALGLTIVGCAKVCALVSLICLGGSPCGCGGLGGGIQPVGGGDSQVQGSRPPWDEHISRSSAGSAWLVRAGLEQAWFLELRAEARRGGKVGNAVACCMVTSGAVTATRANSRVSAFSV